MGRNGRVLLCRYVLVTLTHPLIPLPPPISFRAWKGGGHARQATSRPRPPPPSISSLHHETPSKVLIARFLPIIRIVIIFIIIFFFLPAPSPPLLLGRPLPLNTLL